MPNVIQPQVDGPLRVSGEADIFAADGALIEHADELWICRCGRSDTKPFCDKSHATAGFRDAGTVPRSYRPKSTAPGAPGPVLRMTLMPNGPLRCLGEMKIQGSAGSEAWTGTQASLCRCGESKNKPFCDGSHRDSGFVAD